MYLIHDVFIGNQKQTQIRKILTKGELTYASCTKKKIYNTIYNKKKFFLHNPHIISVKRFMKSLPTRLNST